MWQACCTFHGRHTSVHYLYSLTAQKVNSARPLYACQSSLISPTCSATPSMCQQRPACPLQLVRTRAWRCRPAHLHALLLTQSFTPAPLLQRWQGGVHLGGGQRSAAPAGHMLQGLVRVGRERGMKMCVGTVRVHRRVLVVHTSSCHPRGHVCWPCSMGRCHMLVLQG